MQDDKPDFRDYATIESYCEGEPVYSLGNLAYIYAVCPDFAPGSIMQEGNAHPATKIKPLKSWEISSNGIGAYMTQPSQRTAWRDDQPMLPIHLIDGNPDTAWCSYGCQVPDGRPEWIRIDLPAQTTVSKVVLVCSRRYGMGNCTRLEECSDWNAARYANDTLTDWMNFHQWAGRALPEELTIQLSRDAWHWDTVYQTQSLQEGDLRRTEIAFEPAAAKQILIHANSFKHRLDKYVAYAFSICGVEVCTPTGQNVALVSRGAGVTASSTSYLLNHDRFTQECCHGPVQYDLGLKITNITADEGMHCWQYVEREKGKLEVDPAFDALVTQMQRNGLAIIMDLDVKGNPAYRGRKLDRELSRITEISNSYYDHPGWVWRQGPEIWAAYLRYVEFIVNHFKGRVAFWGLGADWPHDDEVYQEVLAVVRRVDPQARITSGMYFNNGAIARKIMQGLELSPREKDELPDLVDFSDLTHSDRIDAGLSIASIPQFFDRARHKIEMYRKAGYKGLFTSRFMSWTQYPPGPRGADQPSWEQLSPTDLMYYGDTEMVQARGVAQTFLGCLGLGISPLYCNPYLTSCSVGQGCFRVPVPAQTVTPMQPNPTYYMLRTICTLMNNWKPAVFDVHVIAKDDLACFTFHRGGKENMVAVWIPGTSRDQIVESVADISVPGVRPQRAWIVNLLNGTEQELDFSQHGEAITFAGIHVREYPTLLRMEE